MLNRAFLLVLFTNFLGAINARNDNEALISFDPPGEQRDRSVYVVRAGADRFGVTCAFRGSDAQGQHAVQWLNENGGIIYNSKSIIVQSNAKNKLAFEKKLIFTKIKPHDTGEYRCRVQLQNDDFLEKAIFIRVISNIEWNMPSSRVGGNLGETLTIECGASGDPKPHVEIADRDGKSVEEQGYSVIDNKISIPKLTKEHQNLTFKCIAIQTVSVMDQFNTTTAEEHSLVVDVYFAPEFEYPEVETYTTTGKNVSLQCLVKASYPRVEKFDFYRDNSILFNRERYEVLTDFVHQMAVLLITAVEDDDYGRYRCVAKNRKLSGEQILILKKTAPPKPPFVDVLEVSNTTVLLHIVANRDVDDLPVLSYSISYMPKSYTKPTSFDVHLALLGSTESSATNNQRGGATLRRATTFERRVVTFSPNVNNTYLVRGLEPNIRYELLVRPLNEVGEGDPVLLNIVTGSRHSAGSAEDKYVLNNGGASSMSCFVAWDAVMLSAAALFVF